jgi:hypothetical protein
VVYMINSDMHAYGAARVGGCMVSVRRQLHQLRPLLSADSPACVLENTSNRSAVDKQGLHKVRASLLGVPPAALTHARVCAGMAPVVCPVVSCTHLSCRML